MKKYAMKNPKAPPNSPSHVINDDAKNESEDIDTEQINNEVIIDDLPLSPIAVGPTKNSEKEDREKIPPSRVSPPPADDADSENESGDASTEQINNEVIIDDLPLSPIAVGPTKNSEKEDREKIPPSRVSPPPADDADSKNESGDASTEQIKSNETVQVDNLPAPPLVVGPSDNCEKKDENQIPPSRVGPSDDDDEKKSEVAASQQNKSNETVQVDNLLAPPLAVGPSDAVQQIGEDQIPPSRVDDLHAPPPAVGPSDNDQQIGENQIPPLAVGPSDDDGEKKSEDTASKQNKSDDTVNVDDLPATPPAGGSSDGEEEWFNLSLHLNFDNYDINSLANLESGTLIWKKVNKSWSLGEIIHTTPNVVYENTKLSVQLLKCDEQKPTPASKVRLAEKKDLPGYINCIIEQFSTPDIATDKAIECIAAASMAKKRHERFYSLKLIKKLKKSRHMTVDGKNYYKHVQKDIKKRYQSVYDNKIFSARL